MDEVAVIVAAYNEEQTIGKVIEAFHLELPSARIVVVENGSTDATGAVARAALRQLGCDGAVIVEPRRGKGNAVRRAFLEVDADFYVLVDADMTYPAQQVRELLKPVQAGEADMAVGERFTREQYRSSTNRPMHCFGNQLVKRLVNTLFCGNIVDVMSGFRVLSRRFVRTCPILTEGFQIETEMTLHALDKRLRVAEIPIDYAARPRGSESKVRTVRDGVLVLLEIVRALRQYRPLVFFSTIAMVVALFALSAAAPALNDWIRQRHTTNLPLAMLASTLTTAALNSLGIGLVLDWMARDGKQRFECDLLQSRKPDAPLQPVAQRVHAKSDRTYARAV
jgi:glycosyltransferase involved in cell wall biosynthesis